MINKISTLYSTLSQQPSQHAGHLCDKIKIKINVTPATASSADFASQCELIPFTEPVMEKHRGAWYRLPAIKTVNIYSIYSQYIFILNSNPVMSKYQNYYECTVLTHAHEPAPHTHTMHVQHSVSGGWNCSSEAHIYHTSLTQHHGERNNKTHARK